MKQSKKLKGKMEKLKVKIYIAGQLPFQFNFSKLIQHKSKLFTIECNTESLIDIRIDAEARTSSTERSTEKSITVEKLKEESQKALKNSLDA